MSDAGVNLLQRYVDHTADVQTASIAAVFSTSHLAIKDARVEEWIDGYAPELKVSFLFERYNASLL